jgi:outer membrane protein assembly factor BamB
MRVLDLATGEVRREFNWPTLRKPILIEHRLVGYADTRHELFAGDMQTGERLWVSSLKVTAETVLLSLYSASSKAIYLGRANGSVEAHSLEDGALLWRSSVAHVKSHHLEGPKPGSPSGFSYVFRDLVIYRLWGWIVAVSTKDGRVVWQREMRNAIVDGQLYGDKYYVSVFGEWYVILDAASGAVLLETKLSLPHKAGQVTTLFPILVSESHLFAGGEAGQIFAFERETGKHAWFHKVKGGGLFQRQTYFVSVNQRLYCTDMNGLLYCLEQLERTDGNTE